MSNLLSGIVLGKQKNIVINESDNNFLICGPCRCGKGVNNVIPTLKVYQDSVFVIDWQGEASRYSLENRKKMGHEIFIVSPEEYLEGEPNFSSFNPLNEIRKESEISDAKMIASILLSRIYSLDNIQSSFVKNTAERLLASLILIIKYKGEENTLFAVLSLVKWVKDVKALGCLNLNGENNALFVQKSIQLVRKLPSEEIELIYDMILSSLSFIENPNFQKATDKSDFKIADLLNPEKKISVFLKVGISRNEYAPFLKIILYQITDQCLRNPSLNSKLLLLLDEFPSLQISQYENDFFIMNLKELSHHGIRTVSVIQALNQVSRMFGDAYVKPFLNCFSQKLFFYPNLVTLPSKMNMLLDVNRWDTTNQKRTIKHIIRDYLQIEPKKEALKKALEKQDIAEVMWSLGEKDILHIDNGCARIIEKFQYFKDENLKK